MVLVSAARAHPAGAKYYPNDSSAILHHGDLYNHHLTKDHEPPGGLYCRVTGPELGSHALLRGQTWPL